MNSTFGSGLLLVAFAGIVGGVGTALGSAPDDVARARELLAAAHGAPPVICALAAWTVEQRYGFSAWQPPGGVADSSAALAWALERDRHESAASVLVDGLGDDDPCVREVAARLVARIESRTATDGMLRSLVATSAGTRRAAAVALGLAETTQALDPLIARLGDTDAPVRAAAAWALGGLDQ